MRKALLSLAAVVLFAPFARAESFVLDAAHTRIGFGVKHMVVSNVQGEFQKFSGSFELDAKNNLASAEATADIASINTRDVKRDTHLKSPDFFDAAKFPEMKFVSKKVMAGDGGRYTVIGDLTIKSTTKSIILTGEMFGPIKGMMGETRVGFHAEGKINRKDFGVNFHKALDSGGLVVDDNVNITLDIEGTPKGWVPPAPPAAK